MITDAIHDYVAGQLSGLWSLPKPQRRARLAELRRAVRLLAQNSAAAAQDWTESSVLRRFNALATADSMPEVSHYLRGMVQLFRGNEPKLKLDYPRLAVELYRFQLPDQAANVRLQWGRDLYQMNADTPETEEKEN